MYGSRCGLQTPLPPRAGLWADTAHHVGPSPPPTGSVLCVHMLYIRDGHAYQVVIAVYSYRAHAGPLKCHMVSTASAADCSLNVAVHALQFEFHYSTHERPNMANDTITINKRQSNNHQVKLAICHALAQVRRGERPGTWGNGAAGIETSYTIKTSRLANVVPSQGW